MPLSKDGRTLISTTEAQERSGLSAAYISTIARRGQIDAIRVGNYWLIYEDSFVSFLNQPRKPGPKPRAPDSVDVSSTPEPQPETA